MCYSVKGNIAEILGKGKQKEQMFSQIFSEVHSV